jgi:serine protease Do
LVADAVFYKVGASFFFIYFLISFSPVVQGNQGDFLGLQRRVIEVYKQHRFAVVRIKAQRKELNPAESKPHLRLTIGSGFFISKDGHVLTNGSLIYQMDKILVQFEKSREFPAEVVGRDLISNIALLKIKNLPKGATFVQLDDTPALPQIGHMALTLTCPLQFSASPALGLVTGHENTIGRRTFPTTILRTNIRALPGDSGSPLFGLDGKFLGINVASIQEIQSTCVFPSRATKRILDDLLLSGKAEYGTIGLKVTQLYDPVHGFGLVVTDVLADLPSREAGLQKDDWIKSSIHGPIKTLGDLQNALFFTRVGQFLKLTVDRDGKTIEFSVAVVRMKQQASTAIPKEVPGPSGN